MVGYFSVVSKMALLLIFSLCCLSTVHGLAINFPQMPQPPKQIIDGDWHLIPDAIGNFHLVNVQEAIGQMSLRDFDPEIDVHFELYTLRNPREKQIIQTNDIESLINSNYDPSKPTRLVAHGWNSNGYVTEIFCKGYFEDGSNDVNFIAINWQAGSNTPDYVAARYLVRPVAEVVAKFIDFLAEQPQHDIEKFLVMGHSLGAHVAGIAGKEIKSDKLPRIIAFDPAQPLFLLENLEERVAVGDARLVETIQTAAGTFGFAEPIGDMSFYPNGGSSQPGCGSDYGCSHGRAYDYYVESINSEVGFYAMQCESYREVMNGRCVIIGEGLVLMGGETRTGYSANGVFFLETHPQSPFARGRPF